MKTEKFFVDQPREIGNCWNEICRAGSLRKCLHSSTRSLLLIAQVLSYNRNHQVHETIFERQFEFTSGFTTINDKSVFPLFGLRLNCLFPICRSGVLLDRTNRDRQRRGAFKIRVNSRSDGFDDSSHRTGHHRS